MEQTNFILSLLVFAGGIAIQTWGLIRFFINRIDETNQRIQEQLDEHVKELHNRVNGVKDTYVSRQELDREMGSLKDLIVSIKTDTHSALIEIKNDQHRMLLQINSRLDSFCSTKDGK